jgi:hypothetical protein
LFILTIFGLGLTIVSQIKVADQQVKTDKEVTTSVPESVGPRTDKKKEAEAKKKAKAEAEKKAEAKKIAEAIAEAEKKAKAEAKKEADAIRNAITLQAPARRRGESVNEPVSLKEEMRNLVTNEFAFNKAKNNIYRSTFHQRDYDDSKWWYFARNTVIAGGAPNVVGYDFASERYHFQLHLWCDEYKEGEGLRGMLPAVWDYGTLLTSIKMDSATAERIRSAFERSSLSLTITYKFKKVTTGTWAPNPHFTDNKPTAHNIAFEVEVLQYDWSGDAR